ncbi:DegT/DnrJ/EryC1/StrS family aminotransferase [Spirulina sp. CS-785/01]|uniref:DegT/DnrJ/EryC1/StrS family aminotransferase n=1 Tax=Spirulina sp. CS-785/01 TaxID=3021716 RepID=UPI002330066A|nr:DegT/DnrJ/EryC1/StrS family aminotransferase [Spirulina sp. CS-785/01]MDB9313058.1 DegT/DnrJ/EryC1/StrS family aminotransferase [Spirulina sp. CS-785/01]
MTNIPFVDLSLQHEPLLDEIKQSLLDVVARGDFILGQDVRDFEQQFAQLTGVQYGIGVGSGTDAIALGLQACGLGPGDEVLIPANTFIATVIGALHSGVTPILVDCDPKTALIDLEAAQQAITPKTKAILPVHLYGQMVPPQALLDFAQAHHLTIFEDAAQAHLAHREGYTAGAVGKAAAYSFYPSKNLGAFGNGGIVLTDSEDIAHKIRCYRNYGAAQKYVHTELGTNSRLDTLQAAVLKVKLPHLQDWNLSRNQAAAQYDKALNPLADSGITPLENQSGTGHIYHLYIVRIEPSCPLNRDEIQAQLSDRGISTGIHYPIPCHLQPAYHHLGYQEGDFPQAEALCREILSLPMYPGLSEAQVTRVVDTLKEILADAQSLRA